MPRPLRLFYEAGVIISFLIALVGFDLLHPIRQQIIWQLTGKEIALSTGVCLLIMVGGAGLAVMVTIGYIIDKYRFKGRTDL